MRKAICVCLFMVIMVQCGSSEEQWPPRAAANGLAVCSDMTMNELEAVSRVAVALWSVKAEDPQYRFIEMPPSECLIFVRHKFQKVPEICIKHSGCLMPTCVDRWCYVPNVYGSEHPDYGGLCTEHYVYINRYHNAGALYALLVHELCHAVTGWSHGPEFKALEVRVWDELWGD